MQDLKVTLIQAKQEWEDKEVNLDHFTKMLNEIENPTDLIILPEMFQTSFTMNAKAMGETMEGSSLTWLKQKSREKEAAIMASLIIEADGNYYNRMVFVTPDLQVQYYDKRKLFTLAKEDEHYSSGTENTIVEYKGWKILLQVCYDLRFPEVARNKVKDGEFDYDAIVYVANWPEKRSLHWKVLLQARAVENQCYVVGVNRVGEDANNLSYSGDSCIISPLGEIEQYHAYDEIIMSDMLEVDILQETRTKLPFLQDQEV
ncbi:MAG: amidohydrolase [Bacteroidota bacterium]